MIGGFLVHTHTLDMTTGSPVRLLLRFSLPLFIGNLLQQIYNLSDTAIAGHLLGDAALSQIGATAALYSLITTLAFGLTVALRFPSAVISARTTACEWRNPFAG